MAGYGALLLFVAVTACVVDDTTLVEVLQLSPSAVLATLVMALGTWTGDPESKESSVSVLGWSLAGSAGALLVTAWIVVLQTLEGDPLAVSFPVLLSSLTVGATAAGVVGFYHDRLERRTEQLAVKNDRLDEFASIVSHDLRNPLNVAQGHLEFARRTGEESHFDAVERANDRMQRLVTEVPALARQGEDLDSFEPVDVGRVAEQAWETTETDDAALAVETHDAVSADERRLRKLFENLFRNAVEHADEAATVTVGRRSSGFYVADDGPGIPPEDREQVFEGGYSTHPDGTGLGLAIVRRIADAHGWDVAVTAGESGGARFEFDTVK